MNPSLPAPALRGGFRPRRKRPSVWLLLPVLFLVGLSLILAIGAQNAFLLRQGLRREHVGWVVTVFALSDALLFGIGVTQAA